MPGGGTPADGRWGRWWSRRHAYAVGAAAQIVAAVNAKVTPATRPGCASETMMGAMTAAFAPPGPGQWALDRSHFAGGTTPICQWLMEESMARGMRRVFAEIGVPADTLQARFVNGFMYTRLRPLLRPDHAAKKLPPEPILRIVTHLHPAFRRRAKAAATALRSRPWVDVAHRWATQLRPAVIAENRRLQATNPDVLDDAPLGRHVAELLEYCRDKAELHFWLHGHDLGPIARYLHAVQGWGIPPADALPALAGASPSTSDPVRVLVRLRTLLAEAGAAPTTLDDVRGVSPEAAATLDHYLTDRGHLLVTGYDIVGLTLGEVPGAVLASILDAVEPPPIDDRAVAGALRSRVREEHRAEFDLVLGDARAVMDMRDDNGPSTYEWPVGLLRLALLAVGRRLVSRGRIANAELALELTPAEAATVLDRDAPSGAELTRRGHERRALAQLTPPETLGPVEPAPSLDVLPTPLDEIVAMVRTALSLMGMAGATQPERLMGVRIGTSAYRGRARITASSEDAIENMEPRDVLVVRVTSPAFNAVLSIAGAVVTTEGGPLSHAAVLARELGIPAVVGAAGALDLADGATVEVDPRVGSVRVVT
jgi:phosphohistidine swiveling domain-containing protein